MSTALAHDLIVGFFALGFLWAFLAYVREEFDRIQRARRIFKAWQRSAK